MDIEKVHLGASLELQDPEHQHGTFYDVCNSLLSAEARIFIDNHDDHTLLNSTFPSKTITIADLMILQSKFGTPLSTNVVAKVSNLNVDAKFKKFIRTKINFVKNGMKAVFKRYSEESRNDYLLSPYRTSEGNLKKLPKYGPSYQIIEVAAAQEVIHSSPAHLFCKIT